MPDQSHSETEAVEEKTVSVATVASQAVVKSTQLVIEYSAKPAKGLDKMPSTKENPEGMLIPGGWNTSRISRMRKKTAHSGNTALCNRTISK